MLRVFLRGDLGGATRGPNGEYFPSGTRGVEPNNGIPMRGPGGATRGPNGEYFPGVGVGVGEKVRVGNNIDWNELTKASTKPIVFLVNGFGGCDPCMATYLFDKLKAQGIPVYDLDWNDIYRRKQSTNFDLSDTNFLQQMDSVISKINPSRPIVLIGHSFGGDSVLQVAQRVAPRKIAFLGVLDAVELGGRRSRRSVGSNVSYFYNRWTKNPSVLEGIKGIPIGKIPGIPYNAGIPFNAGISGEVACSASNCRDQKEQSKGYEENGEARRVACGSLKVSCPGYNPIPKVFGGSNGTKHLPITHGGNHALLGDPYIQQQIFTIMAQ